MKQTIHHKTSSLMISLSLSLRLECKDAGLNGGIDPETGEQFPSAINTKDVSEITCAKCLKYLKYYKKVLVVNYGPGALFGKAKRQESLIANEILKELSCI